MRSQISILFLLISYLGTSQEKEFNSTQENLLPYPQLRQFSVSYDYIGKTNYTANFDGMPEETGKVQRGNLKAYGTFKLIDKKKFTLSLTEVYTHSSLDFETDDFPIFDIDEDSYGFDNFNTSLNFTYKSVLFGKPFVSNASVITSTRDFSHLDKVSGLVSATLVFQKNKNTRYTLGLAGIIDPSSQIPAFPVITYWHRFKNPLWELDVVLPQKVKIRRSNTLGGWVSLGSEFSAQSFFIPDFQDRTGTFENRFNEIEFGLSYEKIFMKRFMFSVNTGYNAVVQNNIIEVYKPNSDKIGEIDYDPSFYAKVGISYLFDFGKK